MGQAPRPGVPHDLLPFHASPPLAGVRCEDAHVPARGMADRIAELAPPTDAEALMLLRARYPNSPLALRVAALDLLARLRRRRPPGYSPR